MPLEQMSGMPEQPEKKPIENTEQPVESNKQESERKITTPEEAAEMTRQRRLDAGLEADPKELSPEAKEALEQKINENLGILYSYNPKELNPEMQEQWDFVGMEGECGKDRSLAAAQLEKFLETLWTLKEFKNMGVASETEGKKERIFSREEILSQLGSRCEILKIERELEDEKGVYLLEVINKENTKRFTYQRKKLSPEQPEANVASNTIIQSEDLDDGFSRIIADYNTELDKWVDQ